MILDTLSNGLKDLFSTLGAKTTDSNYAVGLYNKTSGEPQGLMDMSSLASVLGAAGTVMRISTATSSDGTGIMYDAVTNAGLNPNNYIVRGILCANYTDGKITIIGFDYNHTVNFDVANTIIKGESMHSRNNLGTIADCTRVSLLIMSWTQK